MLKRIISIVLILALITLPVISMASSLTEQKNNLQQNINDAKDKQNEVKEQIKDTRSELDKLNDEITEKEYEVEQITAELNNLNEEISKLSEELKEAEEHYEEQYDLLGKRIAAQHKKGTASYLDVLLNSKSLTDFISRYHIIEKIAELDTKLLNDIEDQQREIQDNKKELEKKQSQVADKQKQLENERVALTNRKMSKDKYMSQLSAEEQQLQREIDNFNKELKAVENQLAEEARKAAAEANGYVYSGGQLEWPVPVYSRISSYFGYRGSAATGGVGTANHNGYDIAAPHNSKIVSAEAGQVMKVIRACSHDYPKTYATKCNCGGGYGNYLMINHGGLVTLYGHCASISVNVGDKVYRGQEIAKVGSCGWSTGNHLHFSVINSKGVYVNPGDYVGK